MSQWSWCCLGHLEHFHQHIIGVLHLKLRTALKCSAVQYRGDTVENQLIHFCTAVSYRGVVVLSVVSNMAGYNMVDVPSSVSPTFATVGGARAETMDSLHFLSNALWSTLPRAHSRLALHPLLILIFYSFWCNCIASRYWPLSFELVLSWFLDYQQHNRDKWILHCPCKRPSTQCVYPSLHFMGPQMMSQLLTPHLPSPLPRYSPDKCRSLPGKSTEKSTLP